MAFCTGCGTEVAEGVGFCSSCGSNIGGAGNPVAAVAPENDFKKQYLQQKAFESSIPQKSPGISAVLGFFFPAIGAAYTGRWGMAGLFLILDFIFFLMTFIGIGFVLLFFFRIIAAMVCHSGAQQSNAKRFQRAANSL